MDPQLSWLEHPSHKRTALGSSPRGSTKYLKIGEYGFDEYDRKYAVTCSNCDFVGSKISDYGEAWREFKDWLYKKGYLKYDENQSRRIA